MNVAEFVEKWRASAASERANKDSFLHDLCDILGVPHPEPKTGDPDRDAYVFEREAVLLSDDARQTIGFVDLYKRGCFILEAKQGSEVESKKIGTARRGTPAWNIAMQNAYGQALGYATTIDPPPPFAVITDIGHCFDLYAAFDGSRNYRKFPDALSSRISLDQLAREPRHIETLRAIFTDPHSLDPSKRAANVTREIAAHVATLARALEQAGHEPEAVAKFLMRCLFTMFAEDVELLPKGLFAKALSERWIEHPEAFPGELHDLWTKMNEGGFLFGAGNIWQFNGGLFADPAVLPLTREQLGILGLAAASDWSDVEPAIFGTLLERALSPRERHRLGAHFTPRAYVERLVRPTIEEPLREEWDNVRAQVQTLIGSVDPDRNLKEVAEARNIVRAFYDRLTRIRVLDPACGSGNFLFVALDLFKRLENEVIDLLVNLGDTRPLYSVSGRTVTPEQFLGIEIKPWAKEITELVLWIGWLQWQIRTRGWKSHPQEPILRDYHNIECRDAVLDWDRIEPAVDGQGNLVTRWDGETMKIHPVTGEEVPDDTAQVPVVRYVNPRKAEWPEADFIVGNPPFVGNWRMRTSLGDGYTEALRAAYDDVPDSVDYVMYWWDRAAEQARTERVRRFGLITTNSFSQAFGRRVAAKHIAAEPPLSILLAIPDHPWVDATDDAAVRIAMTVGGPGHASGTLAQVLREENTGGDELSVAFSSRRGRINADLTLGADATICSSLEANRGVCSPGVKLHGSGFIVTSADIERLGLANDDRVRAFVRPYRNGRDIAQTSREVFVVDLFGEDIFEVRRKAPALYQWLFDRIRPQRDALSGTTPDSTEYATKWWLFGKPRPELRKALQGLQRLIVTPETAKH